MKRGVFILAVLVMCNSILFADSKMDEIKSLLQQMGDKKKQIMDMETPKAGEFKKREDDIKWAAEQAGKQQQKLNDQIADLQNRYAPLQAEIDKHNASPPDQTCESCVATYNAEKAQLEARQKPFFDEKQLLVDNQSKIDQIKQTAINQANDLDVEEQVYITQMKELIDQYNAFEKRLDDLYKQLNDDCNKALNSPVDEHYYERIHYACGIDFDGTSIGVHELNNIMPELKIQPNTDGITVDATGWNDLTKIKKEAEIKKLIMNNQPVKKPPVVVPPPQVDKGQNTESGWTDKIKSKFNEMKDYYNRLKQPKRLPSGPGAVRG